jgi:hypothetical protein
VVVKVTNAAPHLISFAKSLKFFERECYFYSTLAPLLRSKCSITNLPVCYASHQHEDVCGRAGLFCVAAPVASAGGWDLFRVYFCEFLCSELVV